MWSPYLHEFLLLILAQRCTVCNSTPVSFLAYVQVQFSTQHILSPYVCSFANIGHIDIMCYIGHIDIMCYIGHIDIMCYIGHIVTMCYIASQFIDIVCICWLFLFVIYLLQDICFVVPIIIIVIIPVITCTHGIHHYIPVTNKQPLFLRYIQCCSCSVFTVYATCNVISPVKYVLYFYISTFCSLCTVTNMAVCCSSLTSCFPGTLLKYCLSDSGVVLNFLSFSLDHISVCRNSSIY
jgi:hypothetical protein